jgi:HlyD family secretion protein
MSRKLVITITLFVLLLAALAYAARTKAPAPAKPAASPQSGFVVAAGRVEPLSEEIKLGPQMDGVLKAVLAEEGQDVRRGQAVAILENGEYSARVELARAALLERQAALDRLRNGSRTEERREADALVREAQVRLDLASAERERRRPLLERGAVSRSEFDMADRDYQAAKARVDAARERAAVVYSQTRGEDLRRAEAEVASAQARIREAEALLDKTVVRAPIDGRILRKIRKAGESVSSNGSTPIIAMGDCSALRVRADVDEADVARLRLGQTAFVKAEAFGDRRFTGTVVQIGQALGRKNVRTDEPAERVDTKILETLIQLDPGQSLPIGLRVDAFLKP